MRECIVLVDMREIGVGIFALTEDGKITRFENGNDARDLMRVHPLRTYPWAIVYLDKLEWE